MVAKPVGGLTIWHKPINYELAVHHMRGYSMEKVVRLARRSLPLLFGAKGLDMRFTKQCEKSLCRRTGLRCLISMFVVMLGVGMLLSSLQCQAATDEDGTWSFVSIPDFLNADTTYPQPGWEDALSYVLESIKAENPDFVLVPGDLVQGRWYNAGEIAEYGEKYYTAWVERMEAHDLKYYAALGDHEIGDNPWLKKRRAKLLPHFKQQFRRHLGMPLNGPPGMKGTAFWFRHKNVLFISVDVFRRGKGKSGFVVPAVDGDQLEWMKDILAEHNDVDFKIVMGHVPILRRVNKEHSSGMKLRGGRRSPLWKTMVKQDVDLYLCGEVHDVTFQEKDGVVQISHGSLFGMNEYVNYLRVKVLADRMQLTLKRIATEPKGDKLWQPGPKIWTPKETVTIPETAKKKGFTPLAQMTIKKSAPNEFLPGLDYEEFQRITLTGLIFIFAAIIGVGLYLLRRKKRMAESNQR